ARAARSNRRRPRSRSAPAWPPAGARPARPSARFPWPGSLHHRRRFQDRLCLGVVVGAEVAPHELGDVANRPLLAILLGSRLQPAEDERAERIAGQERPMASAPGVADASPVHALIPR